MGIVANTTNDLDGGAAPARCSDARSIGWTGCAGLPAGDRRDDHDPGEALRPGAAVAATARQFRIGLAVTFMALASGVTATAVAASAEQRAWQGPVRPRAAFNAANTSAGTGRPTPGYWALCRRSYHVAPGEYWPCPPA
jgi:hypothetical protein